MCVVMQILYYMFNINSFAQSQTYACAIQTRNVNVNAKW